MLWYTNKVKVVMCAVRIMGIDPGFAIVGFGAVDYAGSGFKTVEYGAILTAAKTPFTDRLVEIDRDLEALFERVRPDQVAIEKLFFNTNQKTAIDVAQARGVIVVSAARRGIPVFEYTPLQVKMAVVGYGRAEKSQVMEMTRRILSLPQVPKPDDTADALAIAICHAHSAASQMGQVYQKERTEKR